MSRATITQLYQLGLNAQAFGNVPNATAQQWLDSASARIDSALADRFTLPLVAPYPQDLIECECVFASWTGLLVRGWNPEAPGGAAQKIRYDEWNAWLQRVASGQLTPTVHDSSSSGGGATDDTASAGPFVISDQPVGFTSRGVTESGGALDPWNPGSAA